MDNKAKLAELVAKKARTEAKIAQLAQALDHPHGQWQSAHDLAESDYKVYVALLNDIEEEIKDLESKLTCK